jgi:4-O-beta-D-mannosyl-D-glucose phosphorylase
MTDLSDPLKITHRPGGFFLAPEGAERVGDVSNVVFSNGLIAKEDGSVFIYYASSDTRCHVLTTSVEQLIDWVVNTPEDPLTSAGVVRQRLELIAKNQ